MAPLDATIRSFRRGSDRNAARIADHARVAEASRADDARHDAIITPFCRSEQGVVLGSTRLPSGEDAPVRLPHRIAHGLSSWVVGATGVGKTTALLAWTTQDLATPGIVTVNLDFKGDFALGLTSAVIPWLVTQMSPEAGSKLLAHLRVWAPWSSRTIPSLHLTAQGGAVASRATALTDLFTATVGAGELGPRQQSVFVPCVKLMIEAGGVPFGLLPDVLTNDGFRRALLAAAESAELTAYFEQRFAADAREGVIYSLLSRFDRFLADETTKLALFGPRAFDAADWLEDGTTVVNLSGGLRSHVAFWSTYVQHTVLLAVRSRRATRSSPRVVIRIDEVQRALATANEAHELDDALSTMRSRKCCLQIAHQHAGQLHEHPSLLQSLRANVGMIAAFRVPAETTSATACALPEGLLPGMDAREVSEAAVKEAWVRALAALPNRTFLLRVPTLSPSSIVVRAPAFDIDALARSVPPDIRALAEEGQDGFERSDLAAREERWRAVVAELARVVEPNVDALARFAEPTPDAPRRRRAAAGGPRLEVVR